MSAKYTIDLIVQIPWQQRKLKEINHLLALELIDAKVATKLWQAMKQEGSRNDHYYYLLLRGPQRVCCSLRIVTLGDWEASHMGGGGRARGFLRQLSERKGEVRAGGGHTTLQCLISHPTPTTCSTLPASLRSRAWGEAVREAAVWPSHSRLSGSLEL